LPRPATSRSSVEAPSPRRKRRTAYSSVGASASASAAGSSPSAAAGELFLRRLLDLDARSGDGNDDRVRIVQKPRAFRRGQVGDPESRADLGPAHVQEQPIGHLERQRLDADLAHERRKHAAGFDAGRLAGQLDRDLRRDRLVEANFVEIEVRDPAANRVNLVVLEDRRV
jgi:hypothetical protein